ncbi:hypothetical protein Taro_035279 [Colocasia esculenta]|uniref:Uncharacterized protein n=1 Tax=Colocasia esculenta TaxID=4460 RepID=A0A843VTW7_COLES|nr:hypothetical protein [Colocasia esculenta]
MAMAASPSTAGSTPASGCCRRGSGARVSSPLQRRLFSFFPPRSSPVAVRVGGEGGRGVKWESRGVATASMGGGGREALPPEAVTFSATISTDLPLHDSPEASFEEYLDDRPRIFGAMFPDSRRNRRINDEEWRVQMLPIQFLFASVNPVVVMRLRCRSQGRGYPPQVPPHVSRVLELRATKWELQGLEGGSVPPHFALDVRGLLYPDRGEEGGAAARRSRLRGHLETSISMVLPPVLALVPEHVLRGVAESVLKRLVERMKQEVDGSLLSDFQSFRRERMRKQLTRKNAAQRRPAQSDTDPSRLP